MDLTQICVLFEVRAYINYVVTNFNNSWSQFSFIHRVHFFHLRVEPHIINSLYKYEDQYKSHNPVRRRRHILIWRKCLDVVSTFLPSLVVLGKLWMFKKISKALSL